MIDCSRESWTMYTSTIQLVSEREEGEFHCKSDYISNIMKNYKQAQAKFVPAAAVKRIVQVFNHMTRCKRPQRRLDRFLIKYREQIFGILKKQSD